MSSLPTFSVKEFYDSQNSDDSYFSCSSSRSPSLSPTPSPSARKGKRNAEADLADSDGERIKDVRKRPRGTTAAPAFSTSGFTAPQAQAQPSGFNFGQSQSFPGASSAPAQSNQSSASQFSFGGGASQPSSGFNFSGGFGGSGSGPAANPFAATSFNSGPSFPANPTPTQPAQPAQQAPSFSFGGFGANQTAPQQPAFSSGLFGQQATNNVSANSGADSMQTSPDSKPKTNVGNTSPSLPSMDSSLNRSLFGDSGASQDLSSKKATPANAPSNLFGGLNAPLNAAKTSSPFSFGTSAPAQSTGPESSNASSDPILFSNANPLPSPIAGNPFTGKGASSTAQKPSFLFGSVTPQSTKPQTPNATSSDGMLISNANSAPSSQPSNPFSGLGASSTAQNPSVPFSFGPVTTKPAEPEKPNVAEKAPLFGAATSSVQQEKASAPKAPLFGAATNSVSQSENGNAAPSAASNLFSAKPATPAAGNPFAGLGAPSKPAESYTPPPPFSFNSSTPKPAEPETANATPKASMFGAATSSAQQEKASAPKAPLFGAATNSVSQSENGNVAPSAASNLFSAKPATSAAGNPFAGLGAPSKPAESYTPPPPFPFNPSTPKPAEPEKATATPKASLFGTAAPSAQPEKASVPSKAPLFGAATPPVSQPDKVKTIGDDIPHPDFSHLTQDQQDKALLHWKIRTLDICFQREIAQSRPGETLFDNMLLFYIKVRQALGHPVKERPELKRPETTKASDKTPTQNGEAVTNGDHGSTTASIFAKSFSSPGPAQDSSSSAPKLGAQTSTPAAPNFGAASSSTAPQFGAAPSSSAAPKFGAPSSSAAPKFGAPSSSTAPKFGAPSSSTAPKFGAPSSSAAPKFGAPSSSTAPKFGNGTSGPVDFMAQFKKTAEDNAAKEKAKRKAEEFDSEEDDEEEWERRDAEKQREKRAKFTSDAAKADAAKSVWIPGQGCKPVDSAKSTTPTPAEKPSPVPSSSASIFDSPSLPVSDSENIFGRVPTPQPPVDDDKDSDASDAESHAISPRRRAEDDASVDALRKSKRAKSPENTATPKPSLDHTWKPSEPIKFGASATTSTASPSSIFAAAPTSIFAAAPAATPAATPATETSASETNDDESAPGAIFSLAEDAAETEGEECVFKCRGRAFKLGTGWESQGTGFVSLLVHESGRARIVLRADPSGAVILNTLLKKEFEYQLTNSSIQFMVPRVDGPLEHWAVRVKADSINAFHAKVESIKY
ncbi:hypothetical protein N7454_010336 [Penicillium verhagenii]|nr:hypothetical protein N7454_010336 [Penicillium verhagenii]